MDEPVDRKFAVLCQIARAQHFAWRDAVADLCPDVDPAAIVERMWQITGRGTGAAYLKRIDPSAPLAPQVAKGIVWSSQAMGEDAAFEPSPDPARDEAFVRHADCPWYKWHQKLGLVGEDRPGCDAWFESTVRTINDALGSRLRVETLGALPEGGSSCLRRFWVEPSDPK